MQTKRPHWVQGVLLYLLASHALPGVWAFFFPYHFYASFPGFGHSWVAVDGPYNEHLVRDVGAFFLALTLLCLLNFIAPRLVTVRATAICLLVFNGPHLWYHLNHLHMLPLADQIANVMTLSLNVLLILLLLFRSTTLNLVTRHE